MKTIVFDLDGTLLNSTARHMEVLRRVCRELGFTLSEEQLAGYLPVKREGLSTRRYLTEYCGFSQESAEICSKQWVKWIESPEALAEDVLYPDVLELLQKIGECPVFSSVLITARSEKELLMKQLQCLGILDAFAGVHCVSPSDAAQGKAKAACGYSEMVLWVGDTEVDWSAAQSLEVPFYPLDRGFRSSGFWKQKGLESASDLSQICSKLRIV